MAIRDIPVGSSALLVVTGEARERVVWEAGQRTDRRVLDDEGRPVSSVPGLLATQDGLVAEVAAAVPDALVTEAVALGALLEVTGALRLDVTGGREAYELRSAVTGITGVRGASSLAEIAAEVAA